MTRRGYQSSQKVKTNFQKNKTVELWKYLWMVLYYNMDKIAKLKKNPSKVLAVELCAFNPEMTVQQIADKVGVSKGCI